MIPESIEKSASAWLSQDPDPRTRGLLEGLVARGRASDAEALAELEDAFASRLQFGTAGLRGAMGPGPNRMNRIVVIQAAAGLARWLIGAGHPQARVLVGYDARHMSAEFARDTAEVLAGMGLRPILTATPVPTPLVPFGIGHLDCVAGVVVTASHNPAADNGYKVYVGGSQIIPPTDGEIAACIDHVARRDLAEIPRSAQYETVGESLVDAYVERAASLYPPDAPRNLSWVYTAMHGVGASTVQRVLHAIGFEAPQMVAEQSLPDPDFPTVAFPNPEEPGAMDLAIARARQAGADLVVANDPDADRCAVAIPTDSGWRVLTGDELGWLLAGQALDEGRQGTYACSVVSSTLLGDMASSAGMPFATTLTGFKWIGRVPDLAFGYEEAIGYCTDPRSVADKDGITALVRILQLGASLKSQGITVSDKLDQLAQRFGVHITSQLSFRVSDLSEISDAMQHLRAHLPQQLAGESVTAVDLLNGWNGLPPTDAVLLEGQWVRVVVRPSGTEPKLKCYLQAKLPPSDSTPTTVARRGTQQLMLQLREEMVRVLGL